MSSVEQPPAQVQVLLMALLALLTHAGSVSSQQDLDFPAIPNIVTSVAFAPDGARVLSAGLDVKLWDASTGHLLRTFKGHTAEVFSVAFAPDGTRVLSGSYDQTVKLWDAGTGQLLRTFYSSETRSVAFSPDGARVLSGSWSTVLWDAGTGQLLRTFERH
ncbi:MAG: WD40 repeat domain-containing protein [Hyphomicrobiaceae bacterium]